MDRLPPDLEGLSRWEKFAHLYVRDPERNAARAYRLAGYEAAPGKSEEAAVSQVLGSLRVQALIRELTGKLVERAEENTLLTMQEIMEGLTAIARTTIDQVAPWDEQGRGYVIAAEELTPAQKRAIRKVKFKRRTFLLEDGCVGEETTTEVEMFSPLAAYDQARKFLELLRPRSEDGKPSRERIEVVFREE